MKLTRLALSIFCLLVLTICSHAQQTALAFERLNDVRIDEVGDEDIQTYYQQAANSGLSPEQIFQLITNKGLPNEELTKLKQRLAKLKLYTAPELKAKQQSIAVPARSVNNSQLETAAQKTLQPLKKDSIVFGSELFSVVSTVFEPNINIATPSNYVLGPGDELIINVYGFSEQTYNLTVSPEGNIYIPNVGPLYVNGFTIDQSLAKIKSKLASTIYRNIVSGQTKVSLSLGKIRSIRVTVIGEATKPATYTVSSLSTLFNLLYLCGGPSEYGTYRNIELIRDNEVKRKVDLYNFLTKADLKDNVLLQEGDVVRIPYYKTRVTLTGEVKRQGRFELQPGETFEQLLGYAGGFSDNAYRASVSITQLTEKDRKILDVPSNAFARYVPASSDIITVGRTLNRYANRVTVAGAVLRPGDYELQEGGTLKELLEKAGGLREDAYLQRGNIARLNADMTPSNVSFMVSDVVTGKQTINLKKEDIVIIGSIGEMKDLYIINIEGQVHKPGVFQWRENLTVKDVVFLAGGLTEYANAANVEISRRVKNANVANSEFEQAEVKVIDITEGGAATNGDMVLQPFDIVAVRSLPGYIQQRNVYVDGEVMSAGRYTLRNNNERLSDLVKRFGGFKSGADSNNITLRRVINTGLSAEEKKALLQRLLNVDDDSLSKNTSLKNEVNKNFDVISIDLKTAMANPASTANILLEDGDNISVDRSSSLIRVAGEVYYPTLLPYGANQNMKFYLNQSGGFTENARKNSSMVIYPDGKAKKISRFLFFRSYPEVTPRSEIFIPAKNKNNRSRLSTGEWVAISSIIATLGTLLITAFRK